MRKKSESVDQYAALGVDSSKSKVRAVFKPLIDNEYPDAFVNIISVPDSGGRTVITQHSDGDGSKMVQRLLHYLEAKDERQIGYAVDDALAMNASDVAAAGFTKGLWILNQVLNIGFRDNYGVDLKELIMTNLARRLSELKELYRQHGFNEILFLGGETADLPDQVRSAVFDMTITAYAKRGEIIPGNVCPGDKIWGFASDGRATWESKQNSGIMANGLTLARSCLMWKGYNNIYPDLKRPEAYYTGRFRCVDRSKLLAELGLTIGEALISPTRQWPIVIRKFMDRLIKAGAFDSLHGISINTGGGATKIRNLGHGIVYTKHMPKPPIFFQLIQSESEEEWRHMYKTFNCGVGIDIIGEDNQAMNNILTATAIECGLDLYELGYCRKNTMGSDANLVLLDTPHGHFQY